MSNVTARHLARGALLTVALALTGVFSGTALSSSVTATPERASPILSAAAKRLVEVKPDLSTLPKIERYLRSIGIEPNSVVIQRGPKNYAGPNCPGPAWNCTTAQHVVQVSTRARAADGGQNRFVCRRDRGAGTVTADATPPDQSCTIVQPGGHSNSATCDIQTSGSTGTISQACFITQGGSQNKAVARLVAVMTSHGTEQDVVQRIEIKQTGGSSGNTLNASEVALLGAAADGSGDVLTKQDFHQVICGNQIATGAGSNLATVKQQGGAGAKYTNAANVAIEQNREFMLSTCTANPPGAGPFADIAGAGHDPLSCAVASSSFGSPKLGANTCARIQQESASGRNRIVRQDQTNVLASFVDGAANVDIEQGTFEGGMDSTQDQKSTGLSSIVDAQDVDQWVSVRNATGVVDITEIEDPRCCAGGHQLGNAGNTWGLVQDLAQRAFVDDELVDPELFGGGLIEQFGADFGNCTTSGTCTVDQQVSNNVETRSNSCSGASCNIFVSCVAAGEGDLTILQEGGCTTEDDIIIDLRRRPG